MDALARSAQAPLSFLLPAFNSSYRRRCITLSRYALNRPVITYTTPSRRTVASSTPLQQQSAAAKEDPDHGPQTQNSQPRRKSEAVADIKESLDDSISNLVEFTGRSRSRSENSNVNSSLSGRSPNSQTRDVDNTGVLTKSLMSRLMNNAGGKNANFTDGKGRSDLSRMAEPARAPNTKEAAAIVEQFELRPMEPLRMTLGPRLGRMVKIDQKRGVDLGRAFKMLQGKLVTNRVVQDAFKQKFHERPGKKRKRLKMERWRRRFKTAFQATVERVVDMKRKGW